MIELKNTCFSYGSKPFIENFHLEFCDGALTAVIGENGSGKSTLLKLMSGELKSKSGKIFIDGKDTKRLSRRETAKSLSYFPQGRDIPDMTALELVALGRYSYRSAGLPTPKSEESHALEALEYVGATHFADTKLKKMSFGERQRIYLAMQIAQDAHNCLLDEPTNFLDAGAKFSMMETLVRLRDEGRCVVCVLHDISLAMRYADRIVVMKDGKIFADGAPEELYENGSIGEAFEICLDRIQTKEGFSYLARSKNS